MTNKLIERLINKEYLTERERKEWLNAVKERLEALEKENKELRKNNKEIEELYLNENKHWCETIDSLRKENENLKEKLNGIPPEYDGYLYFAQGISNVVKENEKLKKALCVFSTHLQIERGCQEEWLQFKNGEDQSDDLTQEEYKLLKDVLGNKI